MKVVFFSWIFLMIAVATSWFWGVALRDSLLDWWHRDRNAPAVALAELIVTLINVHPQDWEASSARLTHTKTSMSIWVANAHSGLPYLRIETDGTLIRPPLRQRRKIYRAYKAWKKMKETERLARAYAALSGKLHVIHGGRREA